MGFKEIELKGMYWLHLVSDINQKLAFLYKVTKFWASWNVRKFLSSCKNINFARKSLFHVVS